MVVQWKTYIESEIITFGDLTCTRCSLHSVLASSQDGPSHFPGWSRCRWIRLQWISCTLRGSSSYKWTISIQEVIVLEPRPAVPNKKRPSEEPTTWRLVKIEWLGMPNTDISGVTPTVLEMSAWENMKHHFPITLFLQARIKPFIAEPDNK